jgi:undecaprenyl phosphate-alpha-L-ara4N flippase subunit ArnE
MKVAVTMIAMIGCTVAANLLLKVGATRSATGAEIVSLVNWQVLFGLASFGAAGLLYAVVLRWLPLNVAQSFAAAQFVAVIVAAAMVLSEPISLGQWVGISLIATGIFVVGVAAP